MLIQILYLKLQIFSKDADKDTVILLSARASRVENQDAIDASIVGMLGDPKEVSVLVLVIVIQVSIYRVDIKGNFVIFNVPGCIGKSRDYRGAFPALQPS